MGKYRRLPEYYLGNIDAVSSDPDVYADAWSAFAAPLCDLLQADLVSCDPGVRFDGCNNDRVNLSVPMAQRILTGLRDARLKSMKELGWVEPIADEPKEGEERDTSHICGSCVGEGCFECDGTGYEPAARSWALTALREAQADRRADMAYAIRHVADLITGGAPHLDLYATRVEAEGLEEIPEDALPSRGGCPDCGNRVIHAPECPAGITPAGPAAAPLGRGPSILSQAEVDALRSVTDADEEAEIHATAEKVLGKGPCTCKPPPAGHNIACSVHGVAAAQERAEDLDYIEDRKWEQDVFEAHKEARARKQDEESVGEECPDCAANAERHHRCPQHQGDHPLCGKHGLPQPCDICRGELAEVFHLEGLMQLDARAVKQALERATVWEANYNSACDSVRKHQQRAEQAEARADGWQKRHALVVEQRERLRTALEELMQWGVEYNDSRLKYITVQVDRKAAEAAQETLREEPA